MTPLREPLVQFALLGGAMFCIHAWRAPAADNDLRQIVVTAEFVDGLRDDQARRTGQEPTPAEQSHHVREFVRQEVLFREALALGLDRADLVIRRRLVQKMELLLRDRLDIPDPDDADLAAYVSDHADDWRQPAKVSFRHVFVAADNDWDRARQRADALAEQLPPRPATAGDAAIGNPFPRGPSVTAAPLPEIERGFGPALASSLLTLPRQQWTGPVRSHFGWHWVWIEDLTPSRMPPLAEIRDRVADEWRIERRAAARDAYVDGLIARYDVRVDASEPSATPIAASGSRP